MNKQQYEEDVFIYAHILKRRNVYFGLFVLFFFLIEEKRIFRNYKTIYRIFRNQYTTKIKVWNSIHSPLLYSLSRHLAPNFNKWCTKLKYNKQSGYFLECFFLVCVWRIFVTIFYIHQRIVLFSTLYWTMNAFI